MSVLARAREGLSRAAVAPERHIAHGRLSGAALASTPHTPPAHGGIELSVVTTRAGLAALEAEWNALQAEYGRDIHVFQSFNWIWHWANHFLPQQSDPNSASDLYILTGRRDGHLGLVCPFVRHRRAGITVLSFAGEPVGQYGDVLLDEQRGGRELLAHAWSLIVKSSGADVFAFRKVRADSNLAAFLAQSKALITARQVAPYLDLASAPDFETYAKRYSGKVRKNRRRLVRRLEERGAVSASLLTRGGRAAELAATAITLKRAWLKHRGLISPALSNPATRSFVAAVAENRERPVGTVVTHLTSSGETAAVVVAFDCKSRRVAHILVYALEFERFSVGQILIERSVRDAFNDGVGIYDLMAPGDAYKFDWADRSVEVLDWAFGLTPLGRAYAKFYLGHGRSWLKSGLTTAYRLVGRIKLALAKGDQE